MNPVSRFWLWILAKFCLLFGSLGLLNLDNEELICMYTECLAIYLSSQDTSMAFNVIELLEPLLDNLHRFKAVRYWEKCLELSVHYNNKVVEVMLNNQLADLHRTAGDYQAIEYYNKLLAFAREGRSETFVCRCYLGLGLAYNKLSEWKKAIEYFNKCLNVNITDDDKISVYNGLGIANRKLSNYKEAIRFHKEALRIAKDLDDKSRIAESLCNLGNAYSDNSELDQAMDCCRRQLKISLETNDRAGQRVVYGNIGSIYSSHYQYDKAIEYLEKQINIAKELGMKNQEADGYLNMSLTFCLNDDNSKALVYYQKALDIFEVTGDKEGEGRVFRFLANINIQMGKYDEAIKNSHRALDMAEKMEDRKGECISLYCLGTIYQRLEKSHEAIDYYQKSLNIAVKINDRQYQVQTLGGLGHAYNSIGNIQKAEECYRERLKLSLEIGCQKSTGETYTRCAEILLSKGKYSEAMGYLQKSLDIATGIHDQQGESRIYLLLGELQSDRNAIPYYERTLTIAKNIKDKYIETLAISMLGRLYFKLAISGTVLPEQNNTEDNYQKSEMLLREAIKSHEFVSHHLHDRDDFKISFFKSLDDYNCLTEVLIQKQQIEEALLVCERGRGRSLNDLLISKYFISRQDAEALASPILKYDDVQTFLQSSKLCILFYNIANRCIIWVLVHNQPVSYHIYQTEELKSSFLEGNQEQSVARERYVQMLVDEAYDKMKVRDMKMNCEDRSLDVDKIRSHSDKEEVVVASCSSEQDTAAPSNQTEHPDHVSKELSQETPQVQDNRHPLQKLFDILVAPVQSSLAEEEIVIVPQGSLYLVPFAALRDSKSRQYLCDTKRIRLAPSITALKTWQECPADYHSTEGALVIGNPRVGKVKLRGEEHILGPLPAAEREAEYIAGRLGVTALTGSQATKEEVKKRLAKSVAVIHIAAHADSQRGEIALAPSESAIQKKGIPEEEDYLLTMKEVQQIGIRAKLVVLSCCHSGRGDIEPEGLVGMSRAFLAAGARAVIASLWAVDDHVTASFMVTLYSRLKMGRSASASLQQAMKEIRREGYTHPRYWAPFYLIGDDVTIGDSCW